MTPKFRAWDKEDTQMRDVLAVNFYHGLLSVGYEGDQFVQDGMNRFILMQYTGLKDKNGVEIYEGDIVKGQITLGYKRTGVIKFDTDAFCFVEFWKEGMLTMFEENPDRMTIYNGFGGYEVIGNIYENPELLKEQNK